MKRPDALTEACRRITNKAVEASLDEIGRELDHRYGVTAMTANPSLPIDELRQALEKLHTNFSTEEMMPWRVSYDRGRPYLADKLGLIATGTIFSHSALELAALSINALPVLLSAAQSWEMALARIAELEAVLRDIADPLGALQREAEATGGRLSGTAYGIANDPNQLKLMARRALSATTLDGKQL